jgi:two-component system OmpR family response regulator
VVTDTRPLIRCGAATRPAVPRVGDLALDPATHEVWRGEILVSLTRTEFALLEYFMRHPGEALSRLTLVEHVWDEATTVILVS